MKQDPGTQRAMESIADILDLPLKSISPGWPTEVANSADLNHYSKLYDSLNNEDEKFVLMQMIIQAMSNSAEMLHDLDKLEKRLTWDFRIHESTIKKWISDNNENKEASGELASIMEGSLRKNSLEKIRILFICTLTQMRSASAHHIYKNDVRFEVKSAGTHPKAETTISIDLLKWADHIMVMENRHRSFIQKNHPEISKVKKIIVLDIPDDYDFMQTELIVLLRDKLEAIFTSS